MVTHEKDETRSAELDAYYGEEFSATLKFRATAALIDAFAELSGDRSSLHVNESFAGTSMYRRRVVHGMLPVSMIAAIDTLVPQEWETSIAAINGQFSAPAFVDDQIVVNVRCKPGQSRSAEREFTYTIEKTESEDTLASGSLRLRFSVANRPVAPVSAMDEALRAEEVSLPVDTMKESGYRLEDLGKGQVESFTFRVNAAAIGCFALLASAALGVDDRSLVLATLMRTSVREILALTQFSTLVGMRLPGRAATFLNFAARLESPVEPNRDYQLSATVGHVSKGAGLLRTDVAISDAAKTKSISGSTTVLVLPEEVARKSMAALRSEAAGLGLDGKVVLVTGATGGIGETIAKLFSMFGARVVVHYRSASKDAERIVSEILADGGTAVAQCADITNADDVARMFGEIERQYGGIDVLVNNAVRNFDAIPYEDLEWEEIQRDLDVALKGAFLCSQAAIPGMRGRGGKIVNISSVYADNPPRDQLKYAVSKAALEGLSRALAVELVGSNIQVNAVVPSFVDTDVASPMQAGVQRKMAKSAPMRRNAKPEEVAQAVVFLASNFSSYTTGQRLMVTGGGPPFL